MSFVGILFLILVLMEWYFWHHWNLSYFRTGLLLCKQRLSSENLFINTANNLTSKDIDHVIEYKGLELKKISNSEIILRKKRFLYLPVRAKLIYNEAQSNFGVYVYAHWFALYVYGFVVLLISKDILDHPIPVFAGLFGWTIAMYLILANSLLKEIGITKFDPWK